MKYDSEKNHTEITVEAALSFSRPASKAEIENKILEKFPDFNKKLVSIGLYKYSVNSPSRADHDHDARPRRCDPDHPLDKLFKIGEGRKALYTKYVPEEHGVWELRLSEDNGKLKPYQILLPFETEYRQALQDIEQSGGWIDEEDARRKVMALIVRREGQPKFRKELLQAYDGQCAISGCDVEVLLEAAHIVPYKGEQTNHVSNGLLLRADLHKLFDLQMLCIEPSTKEVKLHPSLLKSDYKQFSGVKLRQVVNADAVPDQKALEHHFAKCFDWISQT